MDVTVYDSEYVRALEASVVVSGRVNESGQLVLERGNGEEFNAGTVVPDLNTRWPVGSIYMSFDGADPATKLGGGTWTRLKDRMLIGVGDNPRWDAAREQTGSETVALTKAQMPSHNHGGATTATDVNHTHTGTTDAEPDHNHDYARNTDTAFGPYAPAGSGAVKQYMLEVGSSNTGAAGGHSHTVGTNGMAENNGNHSHGINPEGGGEAHDNMPPVTAVFMWERTA